MISPQHRLAGSSSMGFLDVSWCPRLHAGSQFYAVIPQFMDHADNDKLLERWCGSAEEVR